MRVDVFTQVPHAFGWLTEQKPLATVLGTELELRLFNYRDTTPLRAGQVDDDPVRRRGRHGAPRRRRRRRATRRVRRRPSAAGGRAHPAGPTARPAARRGARGGVRTSPSSRPGSRDSTSGSCPTSARTRSRSGPTSSRAASFPRWCCSTRSRAGCRGRSADGSGELESFSSALDGGIEYPHYTRPAEYRGWDVPHVLLSGDHGRIERWRREQSRVRSGG